MAAVNATGAKTLVVDDDLTPKQQRNLEDALAANGGADVKLLDRTAVILEIFAQHAKSREGQLQVIRNMIFRY
jgi:GTP-binding protein HflX